MGVPTGRDAYRNVVHDASVLPNPREAFFFLRSHPQVKEDLPGAEKCYRAAIEADPEDKDASRRLAKVRSVMPFVHNLFFKPWSLLLFLLSRLVVSYSSSAVVTKPPSCVLG